MKAQARKADQSVELFEIGAAMKRSGLSSEFIAAAVETALDFEGVYDLMKIWHGEDNPKERTEAIADIQDMIDDCSQSPKKAASHVKFGDLDAIARDIRSFKDELRLTVDQKGGIKRLSKLTGIPQPSLSRFFNTASMPRRVTLLKISRALQLDTVKISAPFPRSFKE